MGGVVGTPDGKISKWGQGPPRGGTELTANPFHKGGSLSEKKDQRGIMIRGGGLLSLSAISANYLVNRRGGTARYMSGLYLWKRLPEVFIFHRIS